ncbi:MAG: sensor histidine kinase [Solirubrobacteraceae bacterium]
MIRSLSWEVGVRALVPRRGLRALVPRPVTRGRVQALSRLTAPTHGRGFWLALSVAAVAAGFVALIPVIFDRGPPLPGYVVINRLSGVSFMACGLLAWRQRPDSAVGRLLTVTGFGVLLSPVLLQLDSPVAVTADMLVGDLWIVLFVALFLSFVTGGRLTSTVDVIIVGAFLVDLLVVPFARLLFLPDEDNLLLVSPDAGTATTLLRVRLALGIVASLAVVFVIGVRWRSASRPLRRALLPSLWGAFCAVVYAVTLTSLLVGSPIDALNWPLNAALVTVPAALAWGLLRSRLARGGLADLFCELGTLRGVRLEDGLAKALGDPGLVLAYRVPGERSYLDGRGQNVELPAPGGDRVAAPVERDGRELAMLIYDPSLDDDPELVEAVAAAAAITLDDARLQTESRERLGELRASRERLVSASDAERRRLERNLHDGAQQRLVSVALQLRMIERRVGTDPELAEAIKATGDEISQSLEELRELARGIHPAVLNHGLKAALGSLASRASVPTAVSFQSPERLPEQVELAAYFVACEALANVAKYAQASAASVRISRRNGMAVIEIADDGVGGADETAGTGLQGLADRVAALDGTLRILSPPGAGTVVTAELPCES